MPYLGYACERFVERKMVQLLKNATPKARTGKMGWLLNCLARVERILVCRLVGVTYIVIYCG